MQESTNGSAPPATMRDHLEAWAVRALIAFLGKLPRSVAMRLGARVGGLFYYLDAPDRKIGLANLARAFPAKSDSERRAILHRSCQNLGRMIAEVCHFHELNSDNISDYVTVEDRSFWQREIARAADKGGIILTAHTGNFELLAYAHALLGHPVSLVHRPMHNSLVDRIILEIRERVGTVSLPKKNAARLLLRSLRNRQLVAIPADQNQRGHAGVFANLFGVPACTTPGPARLSAHTGAPIVPAFLVREGESDHHRLVMYPEIELANTGDPVADLIETTERCNRAIERILTEYPDQWIWFHKRWRTRPKGEPDLY